MKKMLINLVVIVPCVVSVCTAEAATQTSGRGRRTPVQSRQYMREHQKIQQDFLNLEKKLGLPTPSSAEINRVRNVGQQPGRMEARQPRFNKIRQELNELLSKNVLTDADVRRAKQLIQDLEDLNPARFPQPNDYRKVLKLRE